MQQRPFFQVTREKDKFRLNIDGGSITFDDDKSIKDLFKMWMKENKLVEKYDKYGVPEKIIIK
jgi:hypothetical protein